MQTASDSFLKNSLNDDTFELIYNRLNTKAQFKNYTVDPANPNAVTTVEDVLSTYTADDLEGMSDFLEGVEEQPIQPTVEPVGEIQTVSAEPNALISEFYNNLTQEQKNILGNLEDLIAEYEDVPFDYSEQEFIESLKCKL